MSNALLEAVRGLRVAEPDLGVKLLLAKLQEQQPDLGAATKEVREALKALKAESEALCSTSGTAQCECPWDAKRVTKLTSQKALHAGATKVIMPVNDNSHWFLVVIDYIARTIRIIDSLGRKHEDVYRNVKRWLKSENATSQIDWKLEHTFQTWPGCVQSQQQADSYNCGVFVIGYVKAMLTGRAFESFSRGACNQMRVGIFNWIVYGDKLV